jgi:hypothetical protein
MGWKYHIDRETKHISEKSNPFLINKRIQECTTGEFIIFNKKKQKMNSVWNKYYNTVHGRRKA